jgi:glycine hydroxymethyltransferase
MKEEEMKIIARAISLALSDFEENKDEVIAMVGNLCKRYPLYSTIDR